MSTNPRKLLHHRFLHHNCTIDSSTARRLNITSAGLCPARRRCIGPPIRSHDACRASPATACSPVATTEEDLGGSPMRNGRSILESRRIREGRQNEWMRSYLRVTASCCCFFNCFYLTRGGSFFTAEDMFSYCLGKGRYFFLSIYY